MKLTIIQAILGNIFPLSLTRANHQAILLGILGLVLSACFPDWSRMILAITLSLTLGSLTGPPCRAAFPLLFDTGNLRQKIAAEVALAHNPGEVLASWLTSPNSLHASSVLLAMQSAVDHIYCRNHIGAEPAVTGTPTPIPVQAPSRSTTPVPVSPVTIAEPPSPMLVDPSDGGGDISL